MSKPFTAVVIATIFLIGCSASSGPKESEGTLIGGIGGAAIGTQFGSGSGVILGVALGALIGSQLGAAVGKSMDSNDQLMMGNTALKALEYEPDNKVSTWENPNTRHMGDFIVTRTKERPNANTVCRDFIIEINTNGKKDRAYGRACRDVRDPKRAWYLQ